MTSACCDHLHYCGADDRHFHSCCGHWHGVGKSWKEFPEPHYPPRGPDIVLLPYPHTLVCPGCGLSRNLPEGWQEMLNSETLTCVECQQVMVEATDD